MTPPVGRFAPSPSGRMHLGNIFTAVISWLSARKQGGKWILRIEDLDPQRSRLCHAQMIEDDLAWLGLTPDEGGLADAGPSAPYSQSRRHHLYADALERLKNLGLAYPCFCRRADIMATQAPHQSDGRIVYAGTCRPAILPAPFVDPQRPHTVRIAVDNADITFTDRLYGPVTVNLASHCGDFLLRRADGAWAYQLAVVVDDAAMGVTEVVRGSDLLLSAAQQLHLYHLLDLRAPEFAHVPLIVNAQGVRLSKRDEAESIVSLRSRFTPEELLGRIACMAGMQSQPAPLSLARMLELFSWNLLPRVVTLPVLP